MAKKQKIQLQQSQDLEAIDAELAAAMDTLEKKNEEVAGLLAEYAPPPPAPESAGDGQPGDAASAAAEPEAAGGTESP